MIKLKRIVPLLMAGAMLVSPVSMSAQAKEIDNVKYNLYSTQTEWNGYINTNNVNIRRGPSTSAASLGQIHYGTKVHTSSEVHDASGRTWFYCETSVGLTGFVAAQYISR